MSTLTPARLPVALDGGLAHSPRRDRPWLPIAVTFAGYPLLWTLGLGVLAYPLGGALAILGLLNRSRVRIPLPGAAALWLAFVAWTATAMIVLDGIDRWVAYGYRSTIYLCATAMLLWILGIGSDRLSDRSVLRCVSALWIATVVGGLVAIISPGLELVTIVERLMPASLLEIGLVKNTVHLQIAAESRFLGFPVGRPEAPFPFTNAWGSNLALITPLVVATWYLQPSRRWRITTLALAMFAVVPWIFSLNRGSWLSLSIGLLYVGARRLRRVPARRVAAVAAGAAIVVSAGLASPLGDLVLARSEKGHSDAGRAELYSNAIDLSLQSPVVGWGAPQQNPEDPTNASIGTHGQLWLLLVSNGIPAALLYVSFFATAWVAAFRWRAPHALWLEATLVVAAVQFPIYELMPSQTIVLAVVAGLALRGRREQMQETRR